MPLHRSEYRSTQLAAFILFTTEPSDRALEGWDGAGEAVEEIAVIRGFTSAATEGMR